MNIGFIGQGFIGKNMANDFEQRGYPVARYDIGEYRANLPQVQQSDVVFVAVPTPTIDRKFSGDILLDAVK